MKCNQCFGVYNLNLTITSKTSKYLFPPKSTQPHQFDLLRQKTASQPALGKSSSQPVATSTPQTAAQQDQSWLQQADIDAADAFLNQLDDTPGKRH